MNPTPGETTETNQQAIQEIKKSNAMESKKIEKISIKDYADIKDKTLWDIITNVM